MGDVLGEKFEDIATHRILDRLQEVRHETALFSSSENFLCQYSPPVLLFALVFSRAREDKESSLIVPCGLSRAKHTEDDGWYNGNADSAAFTT